MSKEKAARRKQAGGAMDPYAMSMQMGPIPGAPQGPGNINNNGMNSNVGSQPASMRPDGVSMHPYMDTGEQYAQMGADILNPMQIPRSQNQQNTPMTSRGYNKNTPYGMQNQPSPDMEDQMESFRLVGEATNRGLAPSPMGPAGMPAVPGSYPAEYGGSTTAGTLPLAPDNGSMVPGSTPTKNPKKGKK